MIVCKYCLEAIESHEGPQIQKRMDLYDICDDNDIVKCEWCDDEFTVDDCPTMYKI